MTDSIRERSLRNGPGPGDQVSIWTEALDALLGGKQRLEIQVSDLGFVFGALVLARGLLWYALEHGDHEAKHDA